MRQGANLLIANVPAMFMAGLAFLLIREGVSAWFWCWFLALAAILSVMLKSKDNEGDAA